MMTQLHTIREIYASEHFYIFKKVIVYGDLSDDDNGQATHFDRMISSDPNDPNFYKRSVFTNKDKDVEDIYKRWDKLVSKEDMPELEAMVRAIVGSDATTEKQMYVVIKSLRKRFQMTPKKSQLLCVYNKLIARGEISDLPYIRQLFQQKRSKSQSGVLVITVLTSPYPRSGKKIQRFSCKWNCYYCPNEPNQPRSYLHDEPAVLRANQNNFDPILQFVDRATTLAMMGHPVDKIELLILGGTWTSYPLDYREEFIRDLFYAANTFHTRIHLDTSRKKMSLLEEQKINESADCKIIGLTLETRPDTITPDEIVRLRRYGCTRVQLGIQHTDDTILNTINRGCTNKDAIDAIKSLKDACYKIDIHLMPNLPGSSVQLDEKMFEEVLHSSDLQVDQWKIYPCEIVPWTVIKKWYDEGSYVPYPDNDLFELLMRVKAQIHPWIRLNRVIRDIPSQYILGGVNAPNARQFLLQTMKDRGQRCQCLRCREVSLNKTSTETATAIREAVLKVQTYDASGGIEYFISFETPDSRFVCGFLRLRLCKAAMHIFPELAGCALVREVHVYGTLIPTKNKNDSHAQHMGFGHRMLAHAEITAWFAGYRRIAIIAGIGARNYYRRFGYSVATGEGGFMVKQIHLGIIICHLCGTLFSHVTNRKCTPGITSCFVSMVAVVLLSVVLNGGHVFATHHMM